MNARTDLPAEIAPQDLDAPSLGASFAAAMPTAIALYLNDALFERVSAIALRMSKATGMTPKHLIAAPEACFAVVSRAITWRLDPFAVGMATYQTPGGSIGFEGKLILAIIENSGKLDPASGGVRFEHYGDWSKVQGKFQIRESQKQGADGSPRKYAAATWTDEDARAGKPTDQEKWPLAQSCGVRVIAQIRGEPKPRLLDFDLIQAQPRNSTLWATDPMTQICYTAVRRFASAVVPSLIMGVPFDPVDNFPAAPIDVTPRDPIAMPKARDEATEPTGEPAAAGEFVQEEERGEPAPAKPQADAPAAAADAGPAALELDSKPAAMTRKASDAQRKMVVDIAKRKGLSIAQMDEILIERFSFGIDELPMGMVGDAAKVLGALPNA